MRRPLPGPEQRHPLNLSRADTQLRRAARAGDSQRLPGAESRFGLEPIPLTDVYVSEIHKLGGTVLGSSRGPQDPAIVVDSLHRQGINMLFCVGGDGTQRGAHHIYEEVTRRGLQIAVVGIPKTIDNDIEYVFRTFGFATALEIAQEALSCGHVEAQGAINGIGLVKLMGATPGFIAAGVDARQPGSQFLPRAGDRVPARRAKRLSARAQGSNPQEPARGDRRRRRGGQHLFATERTDCDASGNKHYHDIGVFLRDKITEYFRGKASRSR